MARFEFRMPDVGEGIHEAELVAWHVRVGDRVSEHDPLLDAMTDKATVSIGSPVAGVVLELRAAVSDVVRVGAVVVVLEAEASSHVESGASAVGALSSDVPGAHFFDASRRDEAPREPGRALATPATRGLAKELGVALDGLVGSGPGGRVLADDVRRRAGESRGARVSLAGRRTAVRGVRRTIAQRMQRAVTVAAHYTFVEECDFGALLALRASLADEARVAGVELTLLPFLARAVVLALSEHPALNTLHDEATDELVTPDAIHLGIATATERGLVVPVVRDANRLGLFDLAREIARLAEAARRDRLQPTELSGSTFTITSLGKQGGLLATPILNLPEVGILGVHRIKPRPIVRDGAIVIADVGLLSLTCDHRFVDGHVGAAFTHALLAHLERPDRLAASP